MAPLILNHLHSRDIDLSPASLRRNLTPYPEEQQLTLIILAGFVALVFVSLLASEWLYKH